MHRLHPLLSTTLVLLFLVLSFNAYACLLPASNISSTEMGNGCPTSEEQPARQVCDAFKTLHVEAWSQPQPSCEAHVVWLGEALVAPAPSLSPLSGILKYPFPSDSSSPLLRTNTTVLRI
jgi:hypothetical protein